MGAGVVAVGAGAGAASTANAFNALRLGAALLVLWSHCYPLTGHRLDEPLRRVLGVSGGEIAVDAFFVVSGFLIAGSLERTRSLLDFTLARVLRIYPALWALLGLTALTYLFSVGAGRAEWGAAGHYVWRNATMWSTDVVHELPGWFESNAYPKAVNGSLWTLPWELRMYVMLAAIGTVFHRQRKWAYLLLASLALAVRGGAISPLVLPSISAFVELAARLVSAYFVGAAIRAWQVPAVVIRRWGLVGLVLLLVPLSLGLPRVTQLAYACMLPWIVLAVGQLNLPARGLSGFVQRNDLSDGTYLWAFPVQQAAVSAWGLREPLQLFLVATPIVVAMAWFSWTAVERPALRWRKPASGPSGRWQGREVARR